MLAITSHVPHLIAYNIVGTAADLEERSRGPRSSSSPPAAFATSPASPRRTRRCGATCSYNNRDAVLEMLGRFNEDLSALSG